MKIKNSEAILFDFDGVLADTMQDNFLAWKKTFENFGINIKKEDYFPLEGMKLIEVARIISNKYNLKIKNYSKIVNLKNKYYLQNHYFSFYPEVEKLVNSLKEKGKLLAIISASPKEKLDRTVPKEFLEKFDVVISGDDTIKGKPYPDPYLNAIKKLNVSPKKSIVIENAPLGIKSTKAAGIYCIAITTTLDKKYLQEADKIVNNHKELIELLV